jgi:hypothetical protein
LNHPEPFFFPFFVVCFCLITLCIIIYCLFLITGTLCIFCCNLNLNFWLYTKNSCTFYLSLYDLKRNWIIKTALNVRSSYQGAHQSGGRNFINKKWNRIQLINSQGQLCVLIGWNFKELLWNHLTNWTVIWWEWWGDRPLQSFVGRRLKCLRQTPSDGNTSYDPSGQVS